MFKLLSNTVDSVSSFRVVSTPINLCRVVYEVCRSIAHETTHHCQENSDLENDKIPKFEEIFVEACKSVTHLEEDQIQNRLDYKLIHFSLESFRLVIQKSVEASLILKSKYNSANEIVIARVHSANKLFISVFDNLLQPSLKFNSQIVNFMRIRSQEFGNKICDARFLMKKEVNEIRNSAQLNEITLKIGDNFEFTQKLIRLVFFMSLNMVKAYAEGVKDRITVNPVALTISKKAGYGVRVIREVGDLILKTSSRNKTVLLKSVKTNVRFLLNLFKTNRKWGKVLWRENSKDAKRFLDKLELEIYYSPKQSLKIKKILLFILKSLFGPKRSLRKGYSSDFLKNKLKGRRGPIKLILNDNS